MILLKLAYEGDINIVDKIQSMRQNFKSKNMIIGISEYIERNTHFINIICDDKDYTETLEKMVYLYISNILYKVIIDYFRNKEMYELLTDNYYFLKHDELIEIEAKVMEILRGEDVTMDETYIYCMNRINNIIEKIKDCIEEKREINVNGFIIFRFKDLIEDIQAVVDKVVEKYMIEKEYNEFIKLLRYFVDVQESKIYEVNIHINKYGEYSLLDSYGKDIFQDFINDISENRFNGMGNVEDIMISGLITNSPRKVIIHGSKYCLNKEFLETINNVFLDRVLYCEGCSLCSSIKETKDPINKSSQDEYVEGYNKNKNGTISIKHHDEEVIFIKDLGDIKVPEK
ncbi:putative sporulation protein YtxC [Alloiococcus sp. CFN-8]|uniref:putative sporulation protein YtxC n=1 Tax=Alloiococcus sp. CFN-8 TaxID=3416081 RepID=UPI003CEAF447